MKSIILIPALLLSFMQLGCKNGTATTDMGKIPDLESSGPETASRNTNFAPAFDGQTRVKGIKTSTAFEVDILAQDLGRPWAVVNLPDNRLLISEKSGHLLIVSTDGKSKKKVTGMPQVDANAQGGLLDVALDPSFATNRILYFSYSEPYGGVNHTAIAKARLSTDESRVEDVQVIFRATPSYAGRLHYGSRLAFDKQGALYATIGERSDKPMRVLAQDQSTYLGKVLKLTQDGKAYPGNPQISGWKPEIYSTGHRNPQGLAIHPADGSIWESEMGPRGGDEINRIQPGMNYGWPTITYGEEYSGLTIGDGISQKEGLEQPVYFWDPSVSPSGMDFYTGSIAEWKNNLMVGCLSGEKIIRLKIENNKVVGEEWLLENYGERFRDVLSSRDGHLYAVTDSGKLFRIRAK